MFWKKKFKAIEEKFGDINANLLNVQTNAYANTNKKIAELKKEIGKRLEEDLKEYLGFKSEQWNINVRYHELISENSKKIESIEKQVAALIETHPNVAMYQGVLNRPETKKK